MVSPPARVTRLQLGFVTRRRLAPDGQLSSNRSTPTRTRVAAAYSASIGAAGCWPLPITTPVATCSAAVTLASASPARAAADEKSRLLAVVILQRAQPDRESGTQARGALQRPACPPPSKQAHQASRAAAVLVLVMLSDEPAAMNRAVPARVVTQQTCVRPAARCMTHACTAAPLPPSHTHTWQQFGVVQGKRVRHGSSAHRGAASAAHHQQDAGAWVHHQRHAAVVPQAAV